MTWQLAVLNNCLSTAMYTDLGLYVHGTMTIGTLRTVHI